MERGERKDEKQVTQIVESIEKDTYIRPNQHTLLSWLREWLETSMQNRPCVLPHLKGSRQSHFMRLLRTFL